MFFLDFGAYVVPEAGLEPALPFGKLPPEDSESAIPPLRLGEGGGI